MILVEALQISCVIGIHPWERAFRQPLTIDLEITTDISHAAGSDSVGDTIDYVTACQLSARIARDGQYQLIETLAEQLAALVMSEFGVPWLRLRLDKPGAVAEAESVGVEIERGVLP